MGRESIDCIDRLASIVVGGMYDAYDYLKVIAFLKVVLILKGFLLRGSCTSYSGLLSGWVGFCGCLGSWLLEEKSDKART